MPVGQIRGALRTTVYNDTYFSFEGIPYGQPPIGDLRFKEPLPAKPWDGVRDCLDFNVKPVQRNQETGQVEGSEDCLYLNVFSKEVSNEKKNEQQNRFRSSLDCLTNVKICLTAICRLR